MDFSLGHAEYLGRVDNLYSISVGNTSVLYLRRLKWFLELLSTIGLWWLQWLGLGFFNINNVPQLIVRSFFGALFVHICLLCNLRFIIMLYWFIFAFLKFKIVCQFLRLLSFQFNDGLCIMPCWHSIIFHLINIII